MSSPASFSLLVVDDEPDLRTLYELTLLREGYDIETAATVEEALMHLKDRTYSAVITDMRLPDGTVWLAPGSYPWAHESNRNGYSQLDFKTLRIPATGRLRAITRGTVTDFPSTFTAMMASVAGFGWAVVDISSCAQVVES